MIPLLIICGPTASGKTNLALKIAQEFHGEIVNADSRQVYQEMNIGTNKGQLTASNHKFTNPEFELQAYFLEQTQIPGWLFNIVRPDQDFSLSQYLQLAHTIIADIISRGLIPIIIGGTGLYIDALVNNYQVQGAPDWDLRRTLESKSVDQLQQQLQDLAPDVLQELNTSDRSNPRRLIRLIEKASTSNLGKKANSSIYNPLFIYPKFEREILYKRIDVRAEHMLKEGLVDEVRRLIDAGYEHSKPMDGMGYREVRAFLTEKLSYTECVHQIQQSHRNYARRQITWFEGQARDYNLHKFDFQTEQTQIFNLIKNFLGV